MSSYEFTNCGDVQFGATLNNDEMMDLITKWTDGLCPVCFEEINAGAIICDECLDRAQSFRRNGPQVVRPNYNDPKYHRPGRNKLFKS
jgi:hypothetical protein